MSPICANWYENECCNLIYAASKWNQYEWIITVSHKFKCIEKKQKTIALKSTIQQMKRK